MIEDKPVGQRERVVIVFEEQTHIGPEISTLAPRDADFTWTPKGAPLVFDGIDGELVGTTVMKTKAFIEMMRGLKDDRSGESETEGPDGPDGASG